MKISRKRKIWFWICGALLLLGLVCALAVGLLSGRLLTQQEAERWQGESEQSFIQHSCFLPDGAKVGLNEVYAFRYAMLDAFREAPDEEVLSSFLEQFYARATSVPPQVLVPFALPDQADLEAFLALQRGGPVHLSVPTEGIETDHLIFPEEAQTYDGYAVYLKGNHGLLEISSPEAETGETLVVFKDSFANCFLPFLAQHYRRIDVVDPRYFYDDLATLITVDEPQEVLFLYNANTLFADTALAGLLGEIG
jgi:hypothetical protein